MSAAAQITEATLTAAYTQLPLPGRTVIYVDGDHGMHLGPSLDTSWYALSVVLVRCPCSFLTAIPVRRCEQALQLIKGRISSPR